MMIPKYLDAGTGSAIWAALTAGAGGVIVVLRIFWYRITNRVKVFIKKLVRKH